MGEEIQIVCQKCTAKQDIGEMRHDKGQDRLVCKKCYYQEYGQGKEERVVQSAESNRVNYYCTSCNFSFSRSEGFVFGGLCFNCGRKTVRRDDTKELVVKQSKNKLDY